ncbi:MAG: FtsW/RodA/SpoVE family cell cycle protein, partial [Planctomycetota bacterium]|nr:FtsW/RodA/SpoVE family cell cycle protein [Planctomycetota bacterium]
CIVAPSLYPLLRPHQKDRIQAMIHQLRDDRSQADSINYQGFRAMTLVGAGGVDGLGAEKSRAVIDFNELPEDHNDMIFAVISNRFGFLGGLATLALYLLWVVGAVGAAAVCKDPFGRIVIVGLTAMIFTQMLINIGMTIGLLPITGMTLPFVSYGGSSLVSAFLMTGLICNIAMRRPAYLQRKSFEFDDRSSDDRP